MRLLLLSVSAAMVLSLVHDVSMVPICCACLSVDEFATELTIVCPLSEFASEVTNRVILDSGGALISGAIEVRGCVEGISSYAYLPP